MNASLSQQVLKKMKLHQQKSQYLNNPQHLLNRSLGIKTHYLYSHQSPTHVTYNEIIHDNDSKIRGRYKLRNCRQPTLKVVERKTMSREKANSLLGLKQLMKQEMQRYSVKKKYQFALQKYANNQIAQSLKLDLLFLPNSVKIPHKNRYRPNKLIPKLNNAMQISGNSLIQKKIRNPPTEYIKNITAQIDFPDIPKKTAGYELKYKRNYLKKNNNYESQRKGDESKHNTQPIGLKQEEFVPLTGWL